MSAGGHQQLTATVPAGEATAWYHPAGINKASPTSIVTVTAEGCRAASADDAEQWCGDADHAGSAPKSAPDEGGSNTTVLRPLNTVRTLWLSSQCGAEDVAPGEAPIGAVLAFVGVPFLIALLRAKRLREVGV